MTIFHLYHQTGRIAQSVPRSTSAVSPPAADPGPGLRCTTTTITTRSKVSGEKMIALSSIQACIALSILPLTVGAKGEHGHVI